MTERDGGNGRIRRWLRIALATIAILVLVLVVPPFISVSRFKSQITQLIAQSLGRPVRLSSVQAHLLPWPGFEISDLSVAEDPAYGAEPVLHASKVTASIRLLALFGGRVEIGKISVDERNQTSGEESSEEYGLQLREFWLSTNCGIVCFVAIRILLSALFAMA